MATIDCRIGGTEDFIIKAGETWQAKLNIIDADNLPIQLEGFVIGPLEVTKNNVVVLTISPEDFTIDGANAVFSKDTPDTLKKGILKFRCPFMPP